MYAIKMNEDKSLVTTVQSTIYQNEKNADTLVFLLPKYYEEENIADCTILLRYILPNGIGKSEELEMEPLPHNKEYYRYHTKANTRITALAGTIELWLCAIDMHDDVVLKTGAATIEVTATKDITDYLAPEDLNQIDRLTMKVKYLEMNKADDIAVNDEGDEIQLTANGARIGRTVGVGAMPVWEDMYDVLVTPGHGSMAAAISSLDDGMVVKMKDGVVDEELVLEKKITIKGANAGHNQNFKQEVESK